VLESAYHANERPQNKKAAYVSTQAAFSKKFYYNGLFIIGIPLAVLLGIPAIVGSG